MLQRVHLALLREAEREGRAPRSWAELYEAQRARGAQQARRGATRKTAECVESLLRHSVVPSLTASYTSRWFNTRTHLARCHAVLAQLPPLQLFQCAARPP